MKNKTQLYVLLAGMVLIAIAFFWNQFNQNKQEEFENEAFEEDQLIEESPKPEKKTKVKTSIPEVEKTQQIISNNE